MREIEFRGKRKDTGEWVYGDLWHRMGDDFKNEAIVSVEKVPCTHVVIPETVGQYTGLKDKNGVKIFEGDIVKAMYGLTPYYDPDRPRELIIGIVGVNKYNQWCLLVNGKEYHIDNAMRGEVIGNIHDNQKLLEEAK